MTSVLRQILFFSILFAFSSVFADNSCRSSVNKRPSLDSLFETREIFDRNWKAWLAEKTDRGAHLSISRYLPEERGLSRWQFFNKRMAPEVREILSLARPNFFNDQILPTPLELTNALIQLYAKRAIPKSDWILPGVILQSTSQPLQFRAFTYLEISKKWPEGFQLPQGFIPEMSFNRALSNGVMPLHFKTDIHERFKMLMVYHDLHHLGSFLNKEYLSIFRHFYKVVYNEIDTKPSAKRNEADYFGTHGGYDFIEEYWRVPEQKVDQLNLLLKPFKHKNGQSLADVRQINLGDLQYAFVLDRQYLQAFKEIETRVAKLNDKLRAAAKSEYNPVLEWPLELQSERAKIVEDFAVAAEPILKIAEQIQFFYEFNIHRIGATVSDQMSFRDPQYQFSAHYDRPLKLLDYLLRENFTRLLKVDWNQVHRSFVELMFPLIRGVQSSPEQVKAELEQKVKNLNF